MSDLINKTYLKIRNLAKKVYFKIKKPKELKFPEIISIELSTICNAKCKFCPHSQIKSKDKKRDLIMSDTVFDKIISGCKGHPELKMIKATLYCEPFVTPNLFERLRKIRSELPRVKIKLISNGAALTKEKADTLIKEFLCDEINFSMDAAEKKTFENFKSISWEKVVRNINYFVLKNKECGHKIKTIASFVHTEENQGQLNKFKQMWGNKIDEFHIGTEVGLNRRRDYIKEDTNLYCFQPFYRLNFLSDGRAVMCCADAFGEVIVGDIKKNTVSEIWNGKVFKNIRFLHLKGRKREIPLCNKCNEWQ